MKNIIHDKYKNFEKKMIDKYGITEGRLRALEAELSVLRICITEEKTSDHEVKDQETRVYAKYLNS